MTTLAAMPTAVLAAVPTAVLAVLAVSGVAGAPSATFGAAGALAATLAVAVVLFAVHELGHYLCAVAVGVPREQLQMHLSSMPPRVEFLGVDGVAGLSRYLDTDRRLTDTGAVFAIAAAGHATELAVGTLLTATALLAAESGTAVAWVATRFVLLSVFVTASYLVVAVVSTHLLDAPFGDPVELWRRSVPGTVAVYTGFFASTAGLVGLLAVPPETVFRFGAVVVLAFVPLALLAATSERDG